FVPSEGVIVTASDARLSYGEVIPAADDATMKNRKIGWKWGMMFAAEDSTAFIPVLSAVYESNAYTTGDEHTDIDDKTVRKNVQAAYEKEFDERFFREHLARFRYKDIADFRQNGFTELGKDLYYEYARELGKFDLGLEILVYGFTESGGRHIFE